MKKPDAKWIESAAKKAGLKAELEEKARHPCEPWQASGRVLVKKSSSKEAILQAVAKQMV